MIYLKKRKIIVDIVTIFFLLLFITTTVIISYSYIRSKHAFLIIASDLIKRDHEVTIDKLNLLLTPTPFINTANYLVKGGNLSIEEIPSLISFMYMMLESYPEFINVYLADAHGNIFLESRYSEELAKKSAIGILQISSAPPGTKFISEILMHGIDQPNITLLFKDEYGTIIKKDRTIHTNYNPLQRPWFIGSNSNIDQHWVGIYPFFSSNEMGLTVSYAIKQSNKLLGVIAADLNLNLLVDQLDKISIGNKHIFILTNNHEIIMSSKMRKENKINDTKILIDTNQINNPIITTAYHLYKKNHQSNFTFVVNDIEYIARFTPFAFNENDEWVLVSIISIDSFIGSLKVVNQHNLIFSGIILIFGLILVVYFSRSISRPIMQLASDTKEMTNLHFTTKIKIKTHVYEILIMRNAINKAKTALSSFAKYIPMALVEQLLERHLVAQLGGEKKNLTIMFTDIAYFTAIAESMDPSDLMIHLSEYFDRITNIIHQYKGNVDKYIGDSVMAFWGAPIENKDHVRNACQALLACHDAIKIMNLEWTNAGKPIFVTRFGLATGEAVAGNVGSTDRLNYTVIGDVVNLAARLQAINKNYGTHMIVSQSVYNQCKDQFLFRPLDSVHVRGKKQKVIIYELMADQSSSAQQLAIVQLSTDGFNAFFQDDINHALELFTELHNKYPDDTMAQFYIKRCRELLALN
jgi:adenylate cyclase